MDDSGRGRVLDLLDRLAPPARVKLVGDYLAAGMVKDALENITPAELFMIGREAASEGLPAGLQAAAQQMRDLERGYPQLCSQQAISAAFGTPKPTLANRLSPQILNLRTFPTLMGYSSRILAESWESNNLFFAALSDELSLPPSQLNVLLPEWTQKTVEQIFATHLEDWPALLRSMRVIAEKVRAETLRVQALETKAAAQ